jgi:ribose transport system permease protein
MSDQPSRGFIGMTLRLFPWLFLTAVLALFGSVSPAFLSPRNLAAITAQASWLIVAASGVNFVLIASGVDLSIGAVAYLAAVALGLALPGMSLWVCLAASLLIGAGVGVVNALLALKMRLPPFIATLALAFIVRGIGLFLSDTQMVPAQDVLATFGRGAWLGLPRVTWIAAVVFALCWLLLSRTLVGVYLRASGSEIRTALRAGVPVTACLTFAYVLSGALAALAGTLSFSQTGAATGAFGLNAEFLAIAAAVLGGTSLFGGHGNAAAPVLGALLITAVQNGLVLVDANPYAYPVTTGAVIFIAAFLDGARRQLIESLEGPRILAAAASDRLLAESVNG